jgi:hypothetical protein
MSAGSIVSASNETDGEPSIERARALCVEALEICDSLHLSHEIGARIQEAIGAIDNTPRS